MIRSHSTRSIIAVIFTILSVTASSLSAQDHPKLKLLSKAAETNWINAVKHHRTQDGSTVAEVLAYAQKMRPKEFKVGSFDIGYSGADGEPSSVAIGYWLGVRRLADDSYADLGYNMSRDGQIEPVRNEEIMTTALEGGRDQFIHAVDDAYAANCQPSPHEKPTC